LKAYGIQSKTIRIGDDTAKGYEKEQFADVFSRYIPLSASASVTTSQPASVQGLTSFPSVTREDGVTFLNCPIPAPILPCDVVTDKKDTPHDNTNNDDEIPPLPQNDDLREMTL
jgi:putative DNA primase/helicase